MGWTDKMGDIGKSFIKSAGGVIGGTISEVADHVKAAREHEERVTTADDYRVTNKGDVKPVEDMRASDFLTKDGVLEDGGVRKKEQEPRFFDKFTEKISGGVEAVEQVIKGKTDRGNEFDDMFGEGHNKVVENDGVQF